MRIVRFMAALGTACLLGGCGSIHLYNAERDAAATAARTDYNASKYGDAIASQRAVLVSLEQSEVAASRKYILALRNTALLALATDAELTTQVPTPATGFIARFHKKTDDRLTALDGPPAARARAHLDAKDADRTLRRARADELRLRNGLAQQRPELKDLPECNDAVIALGNDADGAGLAKLVKGEGLRDYVATFWRQGLQAQFQLLAATCKRIGTANALLAAAQPAPEKLLAAAVKDRDDARAAIEANKKDVAARRAELTAAAAALAAADQQRTQDSAMRDYTCPAVSPSARAKAGATSEAPVRLCAALAALDKLGPLGKKIIAQEKIDSIGVILSAMSGVSPAPDANGNVNRALALVAAATRLGHALDQYQRSEAWPALEPLIIEKQLADAQLASANALTALAADRLAYQDEIVDATRLEITLLTRARSTIDGYGTPPVAAASPCAREATLHCDSLEAVLRGNRIVNGMPEERTAYRAMALLAESYAARDRQRTAEVRLNASGYREALILAGESVASWKAILDTPIDQLQAYHAAGLKPSELAPLLQAIGVLGIANGVN